MFLILKTKAAKNKTFLKGQRINLIFLKKHQLFSYLKYLNNIPNLLNMFCELNVSKSNIWKKILLCVGRIDCVLKYENKYIEERKIK